MAGHFDSIGFPADDEIELKAYVERARVEGDQYEVIGAEPGWGGRYLCWNAGGVFAWVAVGSDEETRAGFDLPAFARFYDMACDLDGNALVQIAAFCHGGQCFADEAAYGAFIEREAAENPALAFGVESFLPIGLLSDGQLPPATCRISGRVLEVHRQLNAATNREFWALLVKTVGMTVDVVGDDVQLTGEPVVGGIVAGSFWLSAVPAEGRIRASTEAMATGEIITDGDASTPQITITKLGDEPE